MFPENYITIDFETQIDLPSDFSREVDYHKPVCLAYKFKNNNVDIIKNPKIIKHFCLDLLKSKNLFIVAHNASYEIAIFQNLLGNLWDNKYLLRFISTDVLSLMQGSKASFESFGGISLKDCLNYWNIPIKKQEIGKDLIKTLSFPYSDKTPKKILDRNTADMIKQNKFIVDKQLYKYFFDYCMSDVISTELLFKEIWTPEYWTQNVHIDYGLNFLRNKEGIPIDRELVKNLILNLDKLKEKYIKIAKQVTENSNFNINSPKQMQEYLKLKSTTKEELIKNYKKLNTNQKRLVFLRIKSPKNLAKKLHHVLVDKKYDNFQAWGTGLTRRFTSYGFNFLNIPRVEEPVNVDDFYKNTYNTYKQYKSLTRQIIHTKHIFYGGDFSQIEFRLLLLQTKAYGVLDKMFNGFDFYVYFAQKIYGRKKITEQERYIAKRAVLAFGYGLGVKRFISLLEAENIKISFTFAFKIKEVYHIFLPAVKILWQKYMNDFIKHKKIILPFSKRTLPFYFTKKQGNQYMIKTKTGYISIWGGHLTGIVTQSLAADVFNWKIRQLYKHNFKVIIPFHDEVVCEVKNDSDQKYKYFKKVMQKSPKWLINFPRLEGKFWKADRYLK